MTIPTSSQNEPTELELDQIGNPWMTQILPNLYLGGRRASRNDAYLQTHKITHMLTTMRSYIDSTGVRQVHKGIEPLSFRDARTGIHRLIIPVKDEDSQDIYQYFPTANNFIKEALECRGNVLVHCVAGYSRSPAFVAAYLMSTMKVSMEKVLDWMHGLRKVNPRDGFKEQLEIIEHCGEGEEPLDHWKYILWCYGKFLALGDKAGMDKDTFFARWKHAEGRYNRK